MAQRFKSYPEGSAIPYPQTCATILQKLHEAHYRLKEKHPAEFKDSIRGGGLAPGVRALPHPGLFGAALGEALDASESKDSDKAMDLMSDEEAGWELIAKLHWAHLCDREIKQAGLKKVLATLGKAGHLGPLIYWLDQLTDRARGKLPSLKGKDKNSVYQLVALGRETYNAILTTPDILEFAIHQLQEIDLAVMVSEASSSH